MKHSWIAVLSILLVAPSGVARADGHVNVKKRAQEGTTLFAKGDYGGAIEAFSQVYLATGETKYLFNLALAEYAGQRTFNAYNDFKEFSSKPDASAADIAQARRYEEELEPKLEHLTITAPAGSTVLVDGVIVGTAPLPQPLTVDPDKLHKVLARQGSDQTTQSVSPLGPKSVEVDLAFAPPPAPAVSAPPPAPPEPLISNPVRTWTTVGLGAAALASLGTAIAFGVESTNDHSQAVQIRGTPGFTSSTCTTSTAASCTTLANAVNAMGTDHVISEGFYVGAGVLAAGAVAAWVFLPKKQSGGEHFAVVPILTPQVVGGALTEVF